MVPVTDMTREIVAKQLGATTAADEALVRAHEFLAETLRAKAELMAQMGHEIRTPLNGIVGMTELMLGTELNDAQREYASATMTSATALMVVITDVLDFSMLEAGTLELDVGTFELRHLVDGLSLAGSPRSRESGVGVQATFADDIPAAVAGDGNRVRHVLTKLVGCALARAQDQDVTVSVTATAHGAKRLLLHFEVVAAGNGEDDGSLESLFDPYAHSQGALLADERGSGLGLTVCKQLVELMGGEIGVHAAPGEGTTFWFTTPVGLDGAVPYAEERIRAARPRAAKPERPNETPRRAIRRPAAQAAGGQRVLIADDDPVSQLVLTRQLEARGYAVDVASNGREAIELHAGSAYAAIFMDCQMPELNGFEATSTIREHEDSDAHTPIIAMTASAREADREQCFVSGMDDYVAKPLDQTALDAALARRIPAYDNDDPSATEGGAEAPPAVPLLENSLLTDVFRHNSESRGYLIGVFIDESRTRIAQLAAAQRAADTETMRRLSHALKGSARTIGARRLEQICAAVQEAATEGRVSETPELQALEQCFELTAELLRRGCPEAQDAELSRA
jgi:two-component system sensor histidine kinase/response regulator